jgi:hypothetical protein
MTRFEQKIRYSPLEQRILELIPEDGRKINTIELTGMVYKPGEAPINARQTVLHSVNRLIFKSDENEEPWEIFKSTPRGSQPVYFWREERKGVSNGQSSEEYKVQSK